MDLQFVLQLPNGSVTRDFKWQNPELAFPFISILSIGSFFGTIGNIFIILAVTTSRELLTVGNMFVVNLSLADLCVSGFVGPFNIIGIIEGEAYFVERSLLCTFIACVCLTSCICSLLNIAAVALNRYINILHNSLYQRIFTFRRTLIICLLLWIVSFVMESPNFFKQFGHFYDRKTLSCIWNRTASFQYTFFFSVVLVGTCVVVTSVCYFNIFMYYRSVSNRVRTHQISHHDAKAMRRPFKLAKTLFVIFFAFVICWTPYSVVTLVDWNDQFPVLVHGLAVVVAHTNSCINSLLYGLTNPQFRRAYRHIVMILACCIPPTVHCSVSRSSTNTNPHAVLGVAPNAQMRASASASSGCARGESKARVSNFINKVDDNIRLIEMQGNAINTSTASFNHDEQLSSRTLC